MSRLYLLLLLCLVHISRISAFPKFGRWELEGWQQPAIKTYDDPLNENDSDGAQGAYYYSDANGEDMHSYLRLIHIGDWGGMSYAPYTTQAQRECTEVMSRVARNQHSQAVLGLGDNFYWHGVCRADSPRFEQTFETPFNRGSSSLDADMLYFVFLDVPACLCRRLCLCLCMR